jgi:hypothetical protein
VVGQGLYYGVSVPFRFNNVSNRRGDLAVRVETEATFWDESGNRRENGPLVRSAIVQLRHPETNEILYEQVTESEREPVVFPNLQEGYYVVQVNAPRYAPYRQTWLVEGDRVTQVRAFTPREVVSYRWSVRPTDIPDVTIITLEAVFETNVPQPVVTVNPPLVDLSTIGESAQIDFVVENHGLVTAENVTFELPSHPGWRFTLLTEQIGDLLPRERRVVPVLVERVDGGFLSGGPCDIVSGVRWELVCIGRNYYRVPIAWVRAKGDCRANIPVGAVAVAVAAAGRVAAHQAADLAIRTSIRLPMTRRKSATATVTQKLSHRCRVCAWIPIKSFLLTSARILSREGSKSLSISTCPFRSCLKSVLRRCVRMGVAA